MIFILDNIRSKFNIGSIFRTCDAFAVQKLVLTGFCVYPPDAEITKTAIGAEESVEWQYFQSSLDAVLYYKNQGRKIVAIELAPNSVEIKNTSFDGSEVFVFGNEIEGVSKEILEIVDKIVEIKMRGKVKESMNVGVVAGIIGAFASN